MEGSPEYQKLHLLSYYTSYDLAQPKTAIAHTPLIKLRQRRPMIVERRPSPTTARRWSFAAPIRRGPFAVKHTTNGFLIVAAVAL